MRNAIILGVAVAALIGTTAYAKVELLKEVLIAEVGLGAQVVDVYKVVDGETTCYVTTQGRFGSHAISCVK